MLTLVTGENQNPGRVVCYVASVHDNGVFPGTRAVKARARRRDSDRVGRGTRLAVGGACEVLGCELFTALHSSKIGGCKLLIWRALQDSNLRPPGS